MTLHPDTTRDLVAAEPGPTGHDPRDPQDQHEALAPVRAALLARTRQECARLVAEADEEAARELAAALDRARQVREVARAEGAADAASLARVELARARREARSTLLRAQRVAHDDLRAKVRGDVAALRDDPAYPAFLERVERLARAALGPEAVVTEDPAGGVVGQAGDRRASYTLVALADRVVDELGADLEGLWRP